MKSTLRELFIVMNKKRSLEKLPEISYVREKIRTPDTLVRSQVLYPAELRTHIQLALSCNAGDRNRTGTVSLQQDFKSCASASSATPAYGTYRARTCDPLLVRQMLSQLS